VVAFAQINLGPNAKPTYTIFNEPMITKMGGTKEDVEAGMKRGRFIQANSIPELAKKLGMPEQNLVDTVNKYNKYIEAGKDPDFNKPITKVMIPLIEGPFYGLAQWPAVHHCMGGVRINAKAQVIDVFNQVIPNLFAAGEVGSRRLCLPNFIT